MSRWLITGTAEGGGLDMYIHGKDFSVSCKEAQPNEENIIYTNNTGNTELRKLHAEQMGILSRYGAMKQSIKSSHLLIITTRYFSRSIRNRSQHTTTCIRD